jgi:hypothetical protein
LVLLQPDQPVKSKFASGAAVRVTWVVKLPKDCEQSVPQLIPAGLLVTVPLPVFVTVRTGLRVKAAVAVFAASIVTTQAAVPLQAPLQPVKRESVLGEAVNVT